jgi:predicted ArsR family transcriptional regulator
VTQPIWSQRFFASTRGRIVNLLRRSTLTVDDLARALDLTDNAVRAQLTGLERDGIVRQQGLRKGAGKPSVAYELTPDIEPVLSSAYRPLLSALLDGLAATLPERELVALMRAAGRRLAQELPALRGDPATRASAVSAALNDLGGLAVAEHGPDGWMVRSEGCPLAVVVRQHPKVCKALEAMVGELAGVTVREHCDRSDERPRCCFQLVGLR